MNTRQQVSYEFAAGYMAETLRAVQITCDLYPHGIPASEAARTARIVREAMRVYDTAVARVGDQS